MKNDGGSERREQKREKESIKTRVRWMDSIAIG